MKCLWFWILKKPIRFKCNANINVTALICIHWLPWIYFGSGKEKNQLVPRQKLSPSVGSDEPRWRREQEGCRRQRDRFWPSLSHAPGCWRDGDFRRSLYDGKTVKTQYPFAGKFRHFETWFCCTWKGEFLVMEYKSWNNLFLILSKAPLKFCSFSLAF